VGRAVDHGAVWGEVLAVEVDVGVDETNPVVGLDLQFIFFGNKIVFENLFFSRRAYRRKDVREEN
jgi:hypothetical protein